MDKKTNEIFHLLNSIDFIDFIAQKHGINRESIIYIQGQKKLTSYFALNSFNNSLKTAGSVYPIKL